MVTYSIEEFKQKYNLVMEFCQCVEYELKFINHYFLMVDALPTTDIGNLTMRELANLLKQSLDDSYFPECNDLYYNGEDILAFLFPSIKDRNYWAHNCFSDLFFNKEDMESLEFSIVYPSICSRLKRSLATFDRIYNLCKNYRLKVEKAVNQIGYSLLDKAYYTKETTERKNEI